MRRANTESVFPAFNRYKFAAKFNTRVQQRINDIGENIVIVDKQQKSYQKFIALPQQFGDVFGGILFGQRADKA